MGSAMACPPYDSEFVPFMTLYPGLRITEKSQIGPLREGSNALASLQNIEGKAVTHEEVSIPGPDNTSITLSILRPRTSEFPSTEDTLHPCILWIHGGGLVTYNRTFGLGRVADWVTAHSAIGISVEYRLVPEHSYPAPVEDCLTALIWTHTHAHELGIDASKILIAGQSAGAGLAAAVALMARDKRGPKPCGLFLQYPMIDDRCDSNSIKQFFTSGIWVGQVNKTVWEWYLENEPQGRRRGEKDVSAYAAPSRATDLSNLPPAFIECGSAEGFRDENVDFASRIWAAGGEAELHVWPGAFHAFDILCPDSLLAKKSLRAQDEWVAKILS